MAIETPVQVGIGLIRRGNSFLIRRRPPRSVMAGVWEFPGGKSEPGEAPARTTQRECMEEVGFAVVVGSLRRCTVHIYSHGAVALYYYDCEPESVSAEPDPCSGFLWTDAADLPFLEFPEANGPILRALADEFGSSARI